MNSLDRRTLRPRVHQLRVPNLNEIDFQKLRSGRLARLQSMMKHHNMAACLFYSPFNIRYATGAELFSIHAATLFIRYCIVPATGVPILFEWPQAMHVAERVAPDVRPAFNWQFTGTEAPPKAKTWAQSIRSVLSELGVSGEPLAVDKLDAVGFMALQEAGVKIIDCSPATVDAREVKTDEEVDLFKINGGIGDAMMAAFEAAIRPGIREFELHALASYELLKRHGEFLFTRLITSGTNTNPWLIEAHDKVVMPGDLVAMDTDATGYEGYVIDFSRTFLCGDNPSPGQIEAYRIAYDCVTGLFDLIKPGMSFREVAEKAPKLPEAYKQLRYGAMVHQAGLEDEGPGIPYPDSTVGPGRVLPNREIKENMVLCLECYAGKVGAPFGVKLEDQVVITKDGPQLLCTYPFDATLLG
jgi:Xaa-Pro aminopeptidase